ncbi:hypothetical protein [Acinetobacter bereziniae]|uniref:hypothetical protein n=1 Tax=Acinetobacter bereziniae TaxID=106648 RepID=UPI001D18E50B|nr:hypothetical protein [Acinetobacter bereziniae]
MVNSPESTPQLKNRSRFGKLNDALLARISLCDKDGNINGDEQIVALAVDGDFHTESQYSTQFENSNPEHRMPTLMGMLQTGDWVNTLSAVASSFGVELSEDSQDSLNKLEGRSSLTKTNSTQIFTNTNIQLSMSLVFDAWEDAKIEVEDQVKLLHQWSLPRLLADGSIVANFATQTSIESLFPSLVPPYVCVSYGGKRFAPLLIQSVSTPLVVPMDENGNRMSLQVPVQFLSRNAWDAENINQMYAR